MVKTDSSSAGALVLTAKPVTLTDQPAVNGYPSIVTLALPNLGFSTIDSASPVLWAAAFMSGPSDLFGQETGLFLTSATVAIK